MDYLSETLNVISSVLIKGRQKWIYDYFLEKKRQFDYDSRDWSDNALKVEEGITAEECRWPLEALKAKEMDPPLDPLEGTQPCQYPDFSPVKPISDFWSSEL